MTAEQRLDQLEPLLAQALATLDQHTAQNERHTAQLKVVITAVTQHSDSIAFLLGEQSEMRREQSEMRESMNTRFAGVEDKLDRLLGLLGDQQK